MPYKLRRSLRNSNDRLVFLFLPLVALFIGQQRLYQPVYLACPCSTVFFHDTVIYARLGSKLIDTLLDKLTHIAVCYQLYKHRKKPPLFSGFFSLFKANG